MPEILRYYDENGLPHREAGPAVIGTRGAEVWFHHGKLHREDGPALTTAWGVNQWYLHGEEVSEDVIKLLAFVHGKDLVDN